MLYRCTDQGPWVEGQGPNLVGRWAEKRGLGGHRMTGRTRDDQDLRLSKTSASSPSDEAWRQYVKRKHGSEIKTSTVAWAFILMDNIGFKAVGSSVQKTHKWAFTLCCWRSPSDSQNCCLKPQRWRWQLPPQQIDALQMCFSLTFQLLEQNGTSLCMEKRDSGKQVIKLIQRQSQKQTFVLGEKFILFFSNFLKKDGNVQNW